MLDVGDDAGDGGRERRRVGHRHTAETRPVRTLRLGRGVDTRERQQTVGLDEDRLGHAVADAQHGDVALHCVPGHAGRADAVVTAMAIESNTSSQRS